MKSPKIKIPPPPSPTPVLTTLSPLVMSKALDRRRRMMAALGRSGTILTGLGGQSQTLGLLGSMT